MACILVVDEDENLGSLLGQSLSARGHRVLQARDEAQVQSYLKQIIIDLVVVNLADLRGRKPRPDHSLGGQPTRGGTAGPCFLFLAPQGERPSGLREGKDQWLVTPFAIAELERRVNGLLGLGLSGSTEPPESPSQGGELSAGEAGSAVGPEPQSLSLIVAGLLALDLRRREVRAGQATLRLTPTEFNLLHHLMAHAGEVVSAERLLREVWDYHPGTGSPDLVRVHIKKLRDKLGPFLGDRSNPVRTIPRFGYMMEKESLPLEAPSAVDRAMPQTYPHVA